MKTDIEFDEEAFLRIKKLGGDELLRKMIDIFLDRVPNRIKAAQDALKTMDFKTIRYEAHSIKSSAGNLGAGSLQRHAQTAELLAENNDDAGLDESIKNISLHYEAFAEIFCERIKQ